MIKQVLLKNDRKKTKSQVMEALHTLLTELDAAIARQHTENVFVSKAPVGWHIEHSLLTIDAVIAALQQSEPRAYRWRLSLLRAMVFLLHTIPRGKARAPKAVVPGPYDTVSLRQHIALTKRHVQELVTMDKRKFFTHPFFGDLRTIPTQQFLVIHTEHHLRIIRDILR